MLKYRTYAVYMWWHLQSILVSIRMEGCIVVDGCRVLRLAKCARKDIGALKPTQKSEWIDGNQDMTDIGLIPPGIEQE